MPDPPSFPRLVSLACHDLRSPLATIHGFAATIPRLADLPDQVTRYLTMIGEASSEMAELLDDLSLLARIEGARFEPLLEGIDTLDLAAAAAAGLKSRASVVGEGGTVHTDRSAGERALAALAACALRHGGLERIELRADGSEVRIHPVTPGAEPVLMAADPRDFGAALAGRVIEALGGTLAIEGKVLRITFDS